MDKRLTDTMTGDLTIERGFIRPLVELVVQILSMGSLFHWLAKIWNNHERTPFWFSEAYSLIWLGMTIMSYLFLLPTSFLWPTFLKIVGYRIFELSIRFTRIIIFGTRARKDDSGKYYLVRDPIRWLILVLIDFITINLCFSFFYLDFGKSFDPILETKLGALYQSLSLFIAGEGSIPLTDAARRIAIIEFFYVFLIIIVVAPVILSVIRAKEKTNEQLGDF